MLQLWSAHHQRAKLHRLLVYLIQFVAVIMHAQVRRGWALLRAIHQVEVLAQLQPGSRQLATSKGLQYQGQQEASETVKLGQKLAPDNDPAALEFALATSLHHDGITGVHWLVVNC